VLVHEFALLLEQIRRKGSRQFIEYGFNRITFVEPLRDRSDTLCEGRKDEKCLRAAVVGFRLNTPWHDDLDTYITARIDYWS